MRSGAATGVKKFCRSKLGHILIRYSFGEGHRCFVSPHIHLSGPGDTKTTAAARACGFHWEADSRLTFPQVKKKKKSLQCICHFCKCLILSPDVVVRTKQMGVLKLNDVVHVPGGPCFLMPPLLLPSVVMNLRRPQRTLKEAAGGTR